MRTNTQILGWIEHCQREHPNEGTTVACVTLHKPT